MDDFGLLDFLYGISPWWWVTLGVVLIGLEMATMSFFLIWPGFAALVIGLMLAFWPDLGGEAQVALFAGLAIAFTWIGRTIIARTGQAETDRPQLNRRTGRLIGRRAKVVISFESGEGKVEIDGVRWRARNTGAEVEKGAEVTVTGAEGMILKVEPVAPS
jgi:membrane protein implicated in regulation of membrane protease activity